MRIAIAVASLVLICAAPVSAQYTLDVTDPAGGSVVIGSNFELAVTLDSASGEIQGWSYGICHDSAVIQLDNAVEGATTLIVNGGAPPGFINLNDSFADGYTIGVVINLFGTATLAPGTGYELTIGQYTALALSSSTTVEPCATLGSPAVSVVVVVGGGSIAPTSTGADFAVVEPPPAIDFIRGDPNSDGLINIADGIWALNDLFQGGPHTDCDGANDSNSDGSYDAADAIYIFNYQFLAGPAPAAPFPNCGTDATPDPADCATFPGCP
jgi:hypothetical protein